MIGVHHLPHLFHPGRQWLLQKFLSGDPVHTPFLRGNQFALKFIGLIKEPHIPHIAFHPVIDTCQPWILNGQPGFFPDFPNH